MTRDPERPSAPRPISAADDAAAEDAIARAGTKPPSALSDVFPRISASEQVSPTRAWAVGGWFVAAAALLLWVAAPQVVRDDARSSASAPEMPRGLRERLLAGAADARRVPWTLPDGATARDASGDLVWSDREQAGVVRVTGLAVNDPTRTQYQLWIFDSGRDGRYPVDGGVFDVTSQSIEQVVAVRPRLPITRARRFEITLEPAGGAVVSTREQVVLAAALSDR
jgi:hypothetical protein